MSFSSSSASNMDTTSIYDDEKAFKLDLCMNFPTLEMKDRYIQFSSQKAVTIEPGKIQQISSGFSSITRSSHLVNFESEVSLGQLYWYPLLQSEEDRAPVYTGELSQGASDHPRQEP